MSEERSLTAAGEQQATNFNELLARHRIRLQLYQNGATDLIGLRTSGIWPAAQGNDRDAKLNCSATGKE